MDIIIILPKPCLNCKGKKSLDPYGPCLDCQVPYIIDHQCTKWVNISTDLLVEHLARQRKRALQRLHRHSLHMLCANQPPSPLHHLGRLWAPH